MTFTIELLADLIKITAGLCREGIGFSVHADTHTHATTHWIITLTGAC